MIALLQSQSTITTLPTKADGDKRGQILANDVRGDRGGHTQHDESPAALCFTDTAHTLRCNLDKQLDNGRRDRLVLHHRTDLSKLE